MRLTRPLGAAALVIGTVIATTGPAAAAAPGNDTYPGRVVVAAVPFSTTLDTTEATTDAVDADLNSQCGAPATDASVWYEVTAAADGVLIADVSRSNYSAGLAVATGGPGNWTLVDCAPGTVGWNTTAGQTYAVVAFDDQFDGSGNGGTLNLTFTDQAPPIPSIDATVDPSGGFDSKTGAATIRGTVTCDSADFAGLIVDVSQRVGRGSVLGSGDVEIVCDGTARPFSVTITPFNGKFAGGKAATVTLAFACGLFECAIDFEERIVQLRGR